MLHCHHESKGEHDVISFVKEHCQTVEDCRDWRNILADAYTAHKSESASSLRCKRGYVPIVPVGGTTPASRTRDTDLKEEVQRRYPDHEAAFLMKAVRDGQTVPKLTQEECMRLVRVVLSDAELHAKATQ